MKPGSDGRAFSRNFDGETQPSIFTAGDDMEKLNRDGLRKQLFCLFCALPLIGVVAYGVKPLSQQPQGDRSERFQRMSKDAENRGLAEPFKGVTTDGNIIPGI